MAARQYWRKYQSGGVFPEYEFPQEKTYVTGSTVDTPVTAPRRADGRRLLLVGVAILAAGLVLWLVAGRAVAPERSVVALRWNGVEYMGVGRDFAQIVDGAGGCAKVSQWLEPVTYPPTGKIVNVLKGECIERKESNADDKEN